MISYVQYMMKIQKHARNKYVNQKQVYALHHKVIVEHCKRVIPLPGPRVEREIVKASFTHHWA